MLPELKCSQGVIGVCVVSGHFRSRDKDVGYTVRPIIAKSSCYTTCKLHSYVLYVAGIIAVLHFGNREFRVFLRKIMRNIKIFVRTGKRT